MFLSILIFVKSHQFTVFLVTDPNHRAGYNCAAPPATPGTSSYISDGASHITAIELSVAVTTGIVNGHVVGIKFIGTNIQGT